jgi:hypothetical protein
VAAVGGRRSTTRKKENTSNPGTKQQQRESGLCYNHWKWGDKAYRCVAPCGWAGN